jgi:hypothetical protein
MFAPCDGELDVGVLVKDPSGAGIPGVRVTVLGYSGETDGNGCLKIGGVFHPASIFRDPDVTLSAERTGYKALRERRPIDVYRIEVMLQPADSSKPSSAVWTPVESRASLVCN